MMRSRRTLVQMLVSTAFVLQGLSTASAGLVAGPCSCDADIVPPFGGGLQPDFLDILAVVQCFDGTLPPNDPVCLAADINCDGRVETCDIGIAIMQFQQRPIDTCAVPCAACCRDEFTCYNEQEEFCDNNTFFPEFEGVYQGDGTSCLPSDPCCSCDADIVPPFGGGLQPDFADLDALVECFKGDRPPDDPVCLAADIDCDGRVEVCDIGVAIMQFQQRPIDTCAVPCAACCDGGLLCYVEQEEFCDNNTFFPEYEGVYQGDGSSCYPRNPCDDICEGGANDGLPCSNNDDCPGGLCALKSRYLALNVSTLPLARGPGVSIQVTIKTMFTCDGGPRDGLLCHSFSACVGGNDDGRTCVIDADCESPGLCLAPDCPPDGRCLNSVCVGGVRDGLSCLSDCPPNSQCLHSPREGEVWWAGPSQEIPNGALPSLNGAEVECEPVPIHAENWPSGDFFLFGAVLAPGSEFEVRRCDSVGANCLGANMVGTGKWGNIVDPFGIGNQPNFLDISGAVDKFRDVSGAPPVVRGDLAGTADPGFPNAPDGKVDFRDISAASDGFRGIPYPYAIPLCP